MRDGRATQMGTKGKEQSLYWTITITQRVSGPSIEYQKWEFPPQ